MSKVVRISVGALTLSAAAFIGLVTHEGYTEQAVVPVKGDVPTVGFGSTVHEDGKRVQMGDKTTPVRALIKAKAHIDKEEAVFRKSLEGASLTQGEFDLYMDWVYQYGTGAWAASNMRSHIRAGQYAKACDALFDYRFMTSPTPIEGWEPYMATRAGKTVTRWRFDCSTPGNKVCRGVWTRQQERHAKCLAEQLP